jgi:hypothetical protein
MPASRPKLLLLTTLAALLWAGPAPGGFIMTDVSGQTFTWTIDTTTTGAIASIHITGTSIGDKIGANDIKQPAGWSFTGNAAGGDYSWENPANVAGTALVFSIKFVSAVGSEAGQSVSYDTIAGTTRTSTAVAKPATPTTANWGFTPVPEPSSVVLTGTGIGALCLARSGRRRRGRAAG